MAVTIQSSRFGEIAVSPEQVLDFPTGLIGLDGHQYALITRTEDAAFAWLHSMTDAELAIPVTDPWRFFDEYVLELSDDDAERIGIASQLERSSVWVTVRAASSLDEFCANLRAPIVLVDGTGHQVINQASPAPVRAPLFSGLQEPTKAA